MTPSRIVRISSLSGVARRESWKPEMNLFPSSLPVLPKFKSRMTVEVVPTQEEISSMDRANLLSSFISRDKTDVTFSRIFPTSKRRTCYFLWYFLPLNTFPCSDSLLSFIRPPWYLRSNLSSRWICDVRSHKYDEIIVNLNRHICTILIIQSPKELESDRYHGNLPWPTFDDNYCHGSFPGEAADKITSRTVLLILLYQDQIFTNFTGNSVCRRESWKGKPKRIIIVMRFIISGLIMKWNPQGMVIAYRCRETMLHAANICCKSFCVSWIFWEPHISFRLSLFCLLVHRFNG